MKLIDVAIFTFPSEAFVLESILLAEKIKYSLNHTDSAIIAPGSGVRLSIRDWDVKRAVEIIKEAGFSQNLL
ncbi:MAG: hypothetical protein LBB85_09655 [Dysgonamonadaceae bacterium]|jgi:hypothetical protein|nr:hypothetical protein [Dysgonamonadaceae bacterium]